MLDKTLSEAKRLYEIGFAIHLLYPKSKRPIEMGWTTGPRKPWKDIEKNYRPGMNIGTRLGAASKIKDGFLAVLDIDIKSNDERHVKETAKTLEGITKNQALPEVKSGRGNGSRHLYMVTPKVVTPKKLIVSPETAKVYMPSVKPSKKELATLTPEELAAGIRLRPAWEIALMGEGQQVVLPPSLHPDSGKRYVWQSDFNIEKAGGFNIDFALKGFDIVPPTTAQPLKDKNGNVNLDFVVEVVDLSWLNIHDNIRQMILTGAGVEDRSAMLLPITHALYNAGLSKNEILSVLTEPKYFIGTVAFEHAQTKDRGRAALWLWKYTVKKVFDERSAEYMFREPIKEAVELSPAEVVEQERRFESIVDWRSYLDITDKGKYRATLKNVHIILTNQFGKGLFRFNDFSKIDEQWLPTPWCSEVGHEFKETDIQKMKLWLSNNFGFEANDNILWGAVINISQNNVYHPVREYLEGLPKWDGVKRVDRFLKDYMKGEAPEKYLQAISRKTIVAMIARTLEPGVKFDTMLVLEGKQGLRKSTAIRALCGDKWFSDVNLNLKNKDSISDMNGKLVIEHGEMNVMNAHDVAELKQFLTRSTDRMRPPYGRKSMDFPRQSIFIGSTNESIYLKDKSGNRRFWPFKVTDYCDVDAIKKDRDQLFSEALIYYKAGETLWIDDTETEHLAKLEQEDRETHSDLLTDHLKEWLEKKENEANFDDFFDATRLRLLPLFEPDGPIMGSIFRDLKPDQAGQKRVADSLRALGYERKVLREGGKNTKLWVKR